MLMWSFDTIVNISDSADTTHNVQPLLTLLKLTSLKIKPS